MQIALDERSLADVMATALTNAGWSRAANGGWVSPRPVLSTLSSRLGERRDEPVTIVQAASAQLRHEGCAR